MLKNSIHKYYTTIHKLKQVGGTMNEMVLRRAFAELLQDYAEKKELFLVEEVTYKTSKIRPDGTLRTNMQLDWGYWESKDTKDDLDVEIAKKIAIGYPTSNILFENSELAVLIQNGQEVLRVNILNDKQLDKIISAFINHIPQEYHEFDKAIRKFKEDVPVIADTLRKMIDNQYKTNTEYKKKVELFLETCKQSINPDIDMSNIREMIIQHILTADIFDKIFGDSQFHRENNIASQLQNVIDTFFTRQIKFQLLSGINHYYDFIRSRASQIADHQEKQKFLKAVYENFYSAYNPLGADKLGIVYTPNEIVKFMISSTDVLLEKYFDKSLADENVEILDPATGTGTFICDIIEHLPPHKLENKYKNEIHANEVSILPYYIANLNIEYTYLQKMKNYLPFNNLCFVDTLDNMGFGYSGKQFSLYSLSIENLERIRKQNAKKISVIIGNPPYNANQQSENENNKNRVYPELDKRIEQTYIHYGNAQKTKVYDMYSRFFRWASDRINGKGIVCFITNNSFLEAKGFVGFRRALEKEFSHIYIVDLGGNIRAKTDKSIKTGNVFNIKVGVCITFLIRANGNTNNINKCEIWHHSVSDNLTQLEKLNYLLDNKFNKMTFERIRPDEEGYWLSKMDADYKNFLPISAKDKQTCIFNFCTHGVSTNRDEWVYDFDKENLIEKSKYFINEYNKEVERWKKFKKDNNYTDINAESNPVVDNFVHEKNLLKWSSRLKRDKLRKARKGKFLKSDIIKILFRPFIEKNLFYNYISVDIKGQFPLIFPNKEVDNILISINASKPFYTLVSQQIVDLHFTGDAFCFPLYKYDENGNRFDNISDWAVEKFIAHYQGIKITKIDIFYYIYAVLHNPNYRLKYEEELKREFPKIPFYTDFLKWSSWGKALVELHTNYENIEPTELEIIEIDNKKNPQTKLKLDKEGCSILLDENTKIHKIPQIVFEYQLGSRSALEWILDQYKEKEPSEAILAEKFTTYKFVNYKKNVIELIKKICTVSIRTVEIVKEMQKI
jgi:predicted helicase